MANYPGKGTQLFMAHPTTTWMQIGQVTDISGVGGAMGTRDVTHLDSAAVEKATSIFDGGETTISLIYDPNLDGHKTFQGLLTAPSTLVNAMVVNAVTFTGTTGGAIPFRVVLPSTTKQFGFLGVPKRMEVKGFTPQGTVMADCTVEVSGIVSYPTTT